MFFVGILLVSFTPGLFWLWFYLRKDSHQPAPRKLIALTFGLGCLATIPAAIIEYVVLGESFLEERAGVAAVAPGMLLVVGPVEEVSKFLAVRLKAYRSLYFDEPIDGLVYAAAASLGFASLENLFYVLEFGPEVMLVRAPISTLAHLVFGCIWGYALGLHQASGGRRTLLVIGALALGAFTHAVFNILVSAPLLIPLALLLVTGGALWVSGRFSWAQRMSPFRYRRNYPNIECHSCGRQIRVTSQFCRFCGSRAAPYEARLFCGQCDADNPPDALYCTGCGDRLLQS